MSQSSFLKICSLKSSLLITILITSISFAFAAPPKSSSPEDLLTPIGLCPICPPSIRPTLCDECEDCEDCPECPPPPSTPPPTVCPPPPTCVPPTTPPPPSTPPPVPVCELYRFDFEYVQSRARKSARSTLDQTGAQDLNCFTDLFKNIVNSHDPSTKTHSGSVGSAIWESLLQQVGSNPGTNSNAIYNDNKKYISCSGAYRSPRRDTHNGHFMIGGGQRGGNKGRKTPGCSRGTIYLDDSCKMRVASDVDSNNLCGNISLWHEVATPISLVWSEDYKNIPSTVVGFKLNPYSNSTAWMWRGSEALPLLVYDPERNGSITSASQLLGNWTFGGNGFASLMGGASKNSPWRDGYEALSMFDKDQDGKVSGAELDDLSLWFDYNRDGISQKGEVVPLSELNITALYYTADKVENGSRIASLGFERILDGKVVKGSSIDWVEKDIHNGLGTLIDQLSDGVLTSPKSENNPIKTESDLAARNTMQSMVGVWEFTNDAPLSGSGLLAFDDVDGDIIGLSLSMATSANSKEARGMIVFNHFEPTIEGNQFIHFDTETGNGAIMENKISLPITDNTIEGSTTVIGSPSSNSGSYEYKWKAYRVK